MHRLMLAAIASVALSGAAIAQENQTTDGTITNSGNLNLTYKALEPTTKQWTTVTKDADIGEITKALSDAGWSNDYVAKALPDTGKYDLFQSAVAPGQVSFMAVPKQAGSNARPIQFGLTGLEAIFGNPAEKVSFDTMRDDAIAKLRSAVEAACALPGRPTSLRIQVSIEVLEIEATWNADDVCAKVGGGTNP